MELLDIWYSPFDSRVFIRTIVIEDQLVMLKKHNCSLTLMCSHTESFKKFAFWSPIIIQMQFNSNGSSGSEGEVG